MKKKYDWTVRRYFQEEMITVLVKICKTKVGAYLYCLTHKSKNNNIAVYAIERK